MNVNQSFFSGNGNANFFSEYASIRNGSYGRLLKAYYGKGQTSGTTSTGTQRNRSNVLEQILEERKHPKVSKEAEKANSDLTSGVAKLKNSVTALQNDKTYTNTENGQNASDKVASALKTFVSDYNDVVNSAKKSTLSNKTAHIASMMKSTAANADKLKEMGITINKNGTLQYNEGMAKKADISKVQELFSSKNSMSYGSTVASRLQFTGITSSVTGSTEKDDTTGSSSVSSAAALKTDSELLASDKLYEKVKDQNGNETGKYDIDKILSAAKSFVKNYNGMFDSVKSSTNAGALANMSYIREKTAKNKEALKQFGINLDEKNNRLTIDEETFKKSDMSQVQKFFKDYAPSISTYASLVDHYTTSMAKNANGYTATGTYNVQGNTNFSDAI